MAVLAAGSLLTLSSTSLFAADTNSPPANENGGPGLRGRGMGGPDIEQIAKDLNLTDDQKTKVKAAMETRRQKMMELFQDKNASREDRMAKRQTIMEDFNKALKDAGLTQEQIDKLDKMGPGGRRGQRPGGPGGAGGGEKPPGENQQ